MKYISIGAVMTEGTEHILTVCRGNNKFTLTGDLANVWLAGFLSDYKPLLFPLLIRGLPDSGRYRPHFR